MRIEMDNGPDREVGKLEDLSKATPGMALTAVVKLFKFARGLARTVNKIRQSRVAKRTERAERELVGELFAKAKEMGEDGKFLENILRQDPEWKKYLKPESKSIWSKLFNLLFRSEPQQQAITQPIMTGKEAWKAKSNFLNLLSTKDSTSKLRDLIDSNPQLKAYFENSKKPKDMPLKAVDTDRNVEQRRPSKAVDTNLNVSNNQSLAKEGKQLNKFSDITQHAKQNSALWNEKLRQENKARERGLGSALTKPGIKPPMRRQSIPNISPGR